MCADLQQLDQLYEQHVDDPKALDAIGKKLFNSSQYEPALRFFKQAYALKSDTYPGSLWHTLHRLCRYEEALKLLKSFMIPKEALNKLDDLLLNKEAVEPSMSFKGMNYFWALGITYKALNKKEKANRFLESALRIDSIDDLGYWCLRGNIFEALYRYEQVIDCYEKALGFLEPDNVLKHASMHFNMGHACIKLKRYEESVMHLKEAIVLNPEVAQYHDSLGTTYMKLKQPKEAKKQFIRALELYPDLITALDDLGNYYRCKGKLEKAKEYFQKVLSINPRYSSTYSRLGRTYMAEGNLDEALTYLHKAREFEQTEIGLQAIQKYIDRAERLLSSFFCTRNLS